MKSLIIGVVVVSALIAGGVGGTFAGFVDTEESQGNFYQAGISDLLVNGKNDPIGPKVTYTHGAPQKSHDIYIDLFNWGVCEGGTAYMQMKNVLSEEAGTKPHLGEQYVYKYDVGSDTYDYVVATGTDPFGANVWSSEPEKISEVGDGMVGQIEIRDDDKNLLGEDYASGISDHLSILIEVCDDGPDGILDDADTGEGADKAGDGQIGLDEDAAHNWVTIVTGKLKDIELTKKELGFLLTQTYGWVHITMVLQQIEAYETDPATGLFKDPTTPSTYPWPTAQLKWWPTNALQGDRATWDMLFELNTDP